MTRRLFLILATMLGGTALGWGEAKLSVISPHTESVRIETARAFSAWHERNYGEKAGIEWLDQGGTSDDVRFVQSLFAGTPDGIGMDLFFGGGLDPYLKLKEQGLLQPYRVPETILTGIPAACLGVPTYDPDRYWYGVVLAGFGILSNKRVLTYLRLPSPASWEALGDPRFFSWVGAADPRHSGSMHMMYEIILQAYGWTKGWATIFSLAGNVKNFSASASQVARDTSLGEVAVSICIDSYALSQLQVNGKENIGFLLPEGLTVINPDAVGILKGAPNLVTARRFIDFLLSEEGQELWMLPPGSAGGPAQFALNRLAVRPAAYRRPGIIFGTLNPYTYRHAFPYDFALASRRWALLNDIVGSCIIDCHGDLKRAWKAVAGAAEPTALQEFAALPCGEKDQEQLCRRWSDPSVRNETINGWLSFSKRKFHHLSSGRKKR